MRTGTWGFIGAALLLLIDLVWSFSGPMGWGNNGECGVGNAQLQMIATIVRKKNGTTSEWSIPESAMITCGNVSGSTDQFKISVKWAWETENLASSSTVASNQSTKAPDAAKPTSKPVPTADPNTTSAPTQADAATQSTSPTVKTKEKRDSDNLFLGKDLEFSIDSGTSTTGTSATTETTTVTTQTSLRTDVPGGTSTTVSGTTTDSATITAEASSTTVDVSTSTEVSSSATESSTSKTDSTTEVRVPGVKFLSGGIYKQSTVLDEATDATSPFEVVTRRSGSYRSKGIFEKFQEPPEIIRSCYPYCDSDEDTAWLRFEEPHRNRLTFTVTKSNSLFHVSNIYIYYELPDEKIVYRIYWQNVKLFPGPMDTTHVCENITKLQLNYDAELVLQGTKLAAFLPQDHCEFPKSEAGCNCKYEEEEENRFCKTAEIIMITVGAVLGVLLLSGLGFYIGKLYCKSRREREARDTIP